jgi:hypothetical protein
LKIFGQKIIILAYRGRRNLSNIIFCLFGKNLLQYNIRQTTVKNSLFCEDFTNRTSKKTTIQNKLIGKMNSMRAAQKAI